MIEIKDFKLSADRAIDFQADRPRQGMTAQFGSGASPAIPGSSARASDSVHGFSKRQLSPLVPTWISFSAERRPNCLVRQHSRRRETKLRPADAIDASISDNCQI
jgi:hypothetical protein